MGKIMIKKIKLERIDYFSSIARIGGVEIPKSKNIDFSLKYIYGIGSTTAKKIISENHLNNKKIFFIKEIEFQKIRTQLEDICTEGKLRSIQSLHIKRFRDIGCYRGRRQMIGLPSNGQRTKTNARTR